MYKNSTNFRDAHTLDLAQRLVAEFPDELEDRRLRASFEFTQAQICGARGRRAEAVAGAQKALSQCKELPLDQLRDRIGLAWVCLDLSQWVEDEKKERELLDEALALFEDDSGIDPPPSGTPLIRSALYLNLGNLQTGQGRVGEAEASYQRALALAKAVDLKPRADLYAPTANNAHSRLAKVYHNLAALRSKEPKQAEELYLKALQLREQVAERHPHVTYFQNDLILNHECLTAFYCSINRYSSAEEHLREAIKLRLQTANSVPTTPSSRPGLAREYGALAEICANTGRLLDAETEGRKGLELAEPVGREQPQDPFTATVLAEVLVILGKLQILNQKTQEGIATLTRAIPLLEDLLRKTPDDNYVRFRLSQAYEGRAAARKKRGELFRAGRDWLRLQALKKTPPSRTSK